MTKVWGVAKIKLGGLFDNQLISRIGLNKLRKRKGDSGDSGELEIKKRNEFKTKLKNEKKKKT